MNVFSLLIAAMLMVFPVSVHAQPADADSTLLSELRMELEDRYERDQGLRKKISALSKEKGFDDEAVRTLWSEQKKRDKENTERLVEIIDLIGWPGISNVGTKGGQAAFLILQHAEHHIQKRFLPLVRNAVAEKELAPGSLALLEDRILVREGKPQIYGSQLFRNPETGELEFSEIADESNVDERRARLGLEPMAAYAKRFGIEYRPRKGH